VAGRQRSKDRFGVRVALEEGLAALEDEEEADSRVLRGMSTEDGGC
jgi:hypothetical protein